MVMQPESAKEAPALKTWAFAVPKKKDAAFSIWMPKDAQVFSVERINDGVWLHALVNPRLPEEQRFFWVAQTNRDLPSPGGVENYRIKGLRPVGTYVGFGTALHLYELEECTPIAEEAGGREPGE
jgi:hypothetical protein